MFSKLNMFFWNLVKSSWFLLVLWTSCNELFNTFLISEDVCDEVVFHSSMFKSPAFLSKLTSIKMYKSIRSVNIPLGKQLVNEVVDPAELRLRETENRDVDLIIRSCDEDDGVWFGVEEARDRTMSAMGKILLDIDTEYKENELDEQKRTGHASKVVETGTRLQTVMMWSMRYFFGESMCQLFLCCRRVIFSWSLISTVYTFNSVSKSVLEVFEIEYCRGHRASADMSCVLLC